MGIEDTVGAISPGTVIKSSDRDKNTGEILNTYSIVTKHSVSIVFASTIPDTIPFDSSTKRI